MAITRTKSPDWGVNEKLTSAQINALDANVTNALDKRSGQTDTLASTVTATGPFTANDFTLGAGGKVKFSSPRSFTTVMRGSFAPMTTNWTAADFAGMWKTTNTSTAYGYISLDIENGAVISQVAVYIEPANGHSALPDIMPGITLYRKGINSAAVSLGSQNDTSANTTAYQTIHAITLSGLNVTVDRTTYKYVLGFSSEGDIGASNSVLGLKAVHSCVVTYTLSQMSDF